MDWGEWEKWTRDLRVRWELEKMLGESRGEGEKGWLMEKEGKVWGNG